MHTKPCDTPLDWGEVLAIANIAATNSLALWEMSREAIPLRLKIGNELRIIWRSLTKIAHYIWADVRKSIKGFFRIRVGSYQRHE